MRVFPAIHSLIDFEDESMETMDHDHHDNNNPEQASSFGATEFANALSQNLNIHGTNAQKLFGKHGLLYRYQRLAQEKSPLIPNNLN